MVSWYLKPINLLQCTSKISRQGRIIAFMLWKNDVPSIQIRKESNSTCESKGKIASNGPFEVNLVQGKRYSWCQCGYSLKQPFCDGQHRRHRTGISPIRFKAEATETAFLCGCKQTNNPPFCDGSHNCDEVQNAKLDL